jgi:hypothetical protein
VRHARPGKTGAPLIHQGMEHRWGKRVAARQVVRLVSGDVVAEGMLLNASLSGAFVCTRAALRRDQRVYLRLPVLSKDWLDAFVVRADESGVALEWDDFACESVLAFLRVMRESQEMTSGEPAGVQWLTERSQGRPVAYRGASWSRSE